MLGGDDDRVHAHGRIPLVFDRHLALAVRAQPGHLAAAARLGEAARDPVRQRDGHGHVFRRLVAGEAEHHALVAGADVALPRLAALERRVDALRDVRALPVQRGQHGAGVPVEAVLRAVITDVADHLADDVVHRVARRRRDLAHHHDDAGRRTGLAGHARIRVLREDLVEHGVADLVADLVGMSLRDGFGRKELSVSGFQLISSSKMCAGLRGTEKPPDSRKSGGNHLDHTSSADIAVVGFSTGSSPVAGFQRAHSLHHSG